MTLSSNKVYSNNGLFVPRHVYLGLNSQASCFMSEFTPKWIELVSKGQLPHGMMDVDDDGPVSTG
jgi:hypothetical protein